MCNVNKMLNYSIIMFVCQYQRFKTGYLKTMENNGYPSANGMYFLCHRFVGDQEAWHELSELYINEHE